MCQIDKLLLTLGQPYCIGLYRGFARATEPVLGLIGTNAEPVFWFESGKRDAKERDVFLTLSFVS